MKNHPGLNSGASTRRRVVERHTTIDRVPETLLENWLTPIKAGPLQGLRPSPESRSEAAKFLAWLRSRGEYSGNSLHTYLAEFRRLCAFMAARGKGPRQLTYEDYMDLMASAGSTKAPMVVKLYLKFLYEVTGDERWRRLYERIRVPRRRKRLPDVLTREQVQRLLEECGREGLDLKVLVALIYETGARAGEILRLRGRDVVLDEHGARIVIRRSKSQARVLRVVMYAPLLAQYLELRRPGPDDTLFPREYNTYLTHLRQAWERAGLPPIRRKFHVLRHTRATELLRARVFTEREMMLWFGWRTREMIDVYAHVTMEDAERSYLAALKGEAPRAEEPPRPVECPRCRSPNPPEARYCLKCGMPLREREIIEEYKRPALLEELLERLRRLEEQLEKIGMRGYHMKSA